MNSPSNLHRRLVEIWNRRDFTAFRALLHPEFYHTGSCGLIVQGPDAGVALAQAYLEAFPDANTEIISIHSEGNVSYGEFVTKGTHTGSLNGIPATGRSVTAPRCNVIEVKDELIYREREYMDMLRVLVQIGAYKAFEGAKP